MTERWIKERIDVGEEQPERGETVRNGEETVEETAVNGPFHAGLMWEDSL